MSFPYGVAVDGAGNLYIADTANQRIRKIDATGTITTIAGTGEYGFGGDGGPAAEAQLSFPYGVAVDGAGNLYIADTDNQRIRKVDSTGTITTIVGTGEVGFSGDGGPATEAQLVHPTGVAVDEAGNLYIADVVALRIRKVDAAGTITTIAGTGEYGFGGDGGPAADAQLSFPYGVAVDGAGNLYIADTGNQRIRKLTPGGAGATRTAPENQTAFDALVIGQRILSSLAPASLYHVDFVEAGRFEETEGAATYAGSYSYTNTGPDTGTVVFNYDDGDSCTNSVTFVSPTTGSLTYTCNDGTSGETNWRLVDDPDYVPLTPPETGTGGTESFSIPDRGGTSTTSSGSADTLRVGYGRIRADAGSSTPAGIAIFQFRDSEGVLISEAGVPASEPVLEGRIFAEVNGPVNTGLAIANPNDVPATIGFYFTDTSGTRFGDGSFELGAHQQRAEFLDQATFNGGPSVLGTFTFTSSVPVAVVALRGFTNESGEFLMTTLPVASLASTTSDTVYFPHFADGNGWVTQVVLVNPTDRTITGTVGFLGQGSDTAPAAPVVLTLDDGQTESSFDYSIPPRSAQRFTTANPPGGLAVGSVRATPNSGNDAPSGLVVFSFASGGKTVSEAGVPALPKGSAFRVYVEAAGMLGQAGSIRSGLAITNAGDTANTVTLEVTGLDGSLAVPPATRALPPSGQIARFLDEIFTLPDNFSGVLRVTSTGDVAVVGLRLRINENVELKMTTTPPSDETGPSTTADLFFPHLADSGGWSTQFILYSGTAGQASSGTLSFIGASGQPLDLTTHVPVDIPGEMSTPAGLAPADQAAFDTLVVGKQIVQDAYNYRLIFIAAGRIREIDGGTPFTGNYRYARTGPNTGMLTYTYDDTGNAPNVERSEVLFTFTSATAGTFVYTHIEGGMILGPLPGSFELVDAESEGESFGVGDVLPGVPTGAQLFPVSGWATEWSGVIFSATADRSTTYLTFDDGGYITLQTGTRYTCQAAGGCRVGNGVIIRGTMVTSTAFPAPPDPPPPPMSSTCAAGLVIQPDGSCDIVVGGSTVGTFSVSSTSGCLRIGGGITFCSGNSHNIQGSRFNQYLITFVANRRQDGSWEITSYSISS